MSIVSRQVLGSKLTTINVGGEFSLYEVNSEEDLLLLVQRLNSEKSNYKIIGAGSNLLLPDENINFSLIKLSDYFKKIIIKDNLVTVAAAASLMSLARKVSTLGLSGLEFASGIPASLGGAIYMNAGAHGGEMANIVERVKVANQYEIFWLDKKEIDFAYRKSNLKDLIILEAELKLVAGDKGKIENLRVKNLNYRKLTQPLQVPSAGSTFKNPENMAAGKIIENLGLKGYKIGNAEMSTLHANWLINPNRLAKQKDCISLISLLKINV